jgi:hypothetical protein
MIRRGLYDSETFNPTDTLCFQPLNANTDDQWGSTRNPLQMATLPDKRHRCAMFRCFASDMPR